ncbi:MAG: ABC transporter ATP-binding protein [Clostridia bacterium]|nr:ABC transporter ATP-binding protein [Clostridia bacterium]
MIKRFIQYYKPHRTLFVLDMLCAFVLAVCDLFYPMITRSMMNDFIPNKQLRTLIVWGVILLFIYLVKMGLNYFIQYFGHLVGVRMQADMRKEAFDHIEKLPFPYFDDHKSGAIMSRVVNDLQEIAELAHHGPEDLIVSCFLLIGSFVLMATINLWLTLIIFACLPFLVLFAVRKRLKMSAAFTEAREEVAEVNATLENSIAGVRVAKAFENSAYESEKFQRQNAAFVKAKGKSYRAMAEFFSGNGFIIDVLNVVILVAGGIFTYYEQITFADFTTFILFVNIFMNPIRKLINFIEQLQNGMSGFTRFCELMDTPVETDAEGAEEMGKVRGEIEFDRVSFSYTEGAKEILSDLNLHIREGETVALVGPSGAGKTTICHILPRFYEIRGGEIRIDGKNIHDVTRSSLRKNIGIVTQDVFLFTGTVFDNIAYGREGASMEEVVRAAKLANIHDFICTLPDGYDTFVGERGVKLSGGQKQRISIARVFLKDPRILILDEATSALDNATEILIQRSLDELCRGRTTIVVAHRLSTVKNADEIVVITEDGIRERGSHSELLDQDGIYAELYRSQFANA